MDLPIRHHDVSLRGLRLRYAEAGEGPPLLLVHGFLVSHEEWLPVLPMLARRFRCIAPDLPGAGKSDKPAPGSYPYTREAFAETLTDLLASLEIGRAHVAGHSMGGAVAMTLAADHPEQIERLTVIDSECYPFPMPLKGRLPTLPLVGSLVFKGLYRRPVFRDYFKNDVWSGHAGFDPARADAYYADFTPRHSRQAAYEVLHRAVMDVDGLAPKIARIVAPTLIVWGDEDRIFPPSLAHRLVREITNSRLEIIEHSGHAPNEEHPQRVADLLIAHHGGGEG